MTAVQETLQSQAVERAAPARVIAILPVDQPAPAVAQVAPAPGPGGNMLGWAFTAAGAAFLLAAVTLALVVHL